VIEKRGGAFCGSSGPRRGCSAVHGWMERTMSEELRDTRKEAFVA
jgi:hypothetical protein